MTSSATMRVRNWESTYDAAAVREHVVAEGITILQSTDRASSKQKNSVGSIRLQELESVIQRNVKAFIKVGAALAEISEAHLYREQTRMRPRA